MEEEDFVLKNVLIYGRKTDQIFASKEKEMDAGEAESTLYNLEFVQV